MIWYNPKAVCPKCGCTGIKNIFVKAGHEYSGTPQRIIFDSEPGVQSVTCFMGECIVRECFNCGYEWAEKPLDAE